MLQIFTKKHRGFTLIELLVVIAIIGILASIVLVSMGGARKSARDSVRKADMRQLVTAQEMFYGTNDAYMLCTQSGVICTTDYPDKILDGTNTYMASTPKDPGTYTYKGVANANNQKFCYYAQLEAGGFYTAAHCGNFNVTIIPGTVDACCP